MSPSGKTVELRAAIDAAVRGTVLHRPDALEAMLAARPAGAPSPRRRRASRSPARPLPRRAAAWRRPRGWRAWSRSTSRRRRTRAAASSAAPRRRKKIWRAARRSIPACARSPITTRQSRARLGALHRPHHLLARRALLPRRAARAARGAVPALDDHRAGAERGRGARSRAWRSAPRSARPCSGARARCSPSPRRTSIAASCSAPGAAASFATTRPRSRAPSPRPLADERLRGAFERVVFAVYDRGGDKRAAFTRQFGLAS